MSKMREEFEAWHIEQCKADGMDWRDISSELDRDGDGYVYTAAQSAWRGWKASRAALCVELPRVRDHVYDYNQALHDVAGVLEDIGVDYK